MTEGRQQGFTLLEVLVALAILAVTLGVAMAGFSGNLAFSARIDDQRRALMLAQSLLAAAGRSEPLEPGMAEGMAEDGLRWKRRISVYLPQEEEAGAQSPRLPVAAYQVSVDVSWGGEGTGRSVALTALRLRPVD